MKWKREMWDIGVWMVGVFVGKCVEVKNEVYLFKNYILVF